MYVEVGNSSKTINKECLQIKLEDIVLCVSRPDTESWYTLTALQNIASVFTLPCGNMPWKKIGNDGEKCLLSANGISKIVL